MILHPYPALIIKSLTMEQPNLLEQAAAKRGQLFMELYQQAFPAAARYISKMGGSFEEAKDIFQDALVIYYEKAVAGPAETVSNEKAYLLGITKYLWIKKFKNNSRQVSLNELDLADSFEDEQEATVSVKLLDFLESAGKKCMDLLRSFYYDKLNMTEIAGQFGFTGTRSATVQKYKCLEKVRDQIKEKALTYEDFFN